MQSVKGQKHPAKAALSAVSMQNVLTIQSAKTKIIYMTVSAWMDFKEMERTAEDVRTYPLYCSIEKECLQAPLIIQLFRSECRAFVTKMSSVKLIQ